MLRGFVVAGVVLLAAACCLCARSWRAKSPRLMEVSAMLPGVISSSGEVMKSKCRVASSVVLAGGALLTCGSAGWLVSSTTGGTVIVDGSVAEPRWISGV